LRDDGIIADAFGRGRPAGHPKTESAYGIAKVNTSIDMFRTKEEHSSIDQSGMPMSSQPDANSEDDNGLEAAVDQAITACGGDMRSTIRALIVANEFLENEVSELMKAVSHAYLRGRFQTYSG
jgi:hypothetical protein